MKFGVREICDVVLKAKANQKVGNKIFYKGEPVIYFDTLKTSSMEGAATTVYAQGGKGNSRLVAWEGERTVTFTMEDALISPAGFMILSGAGLIEGKEGSPIVIHTTELTKDTKFDNAANTLYIGLEEKPSQNASATIYVMVTKDGEPITEPYIANVETTTVAGIESKNVIAVKTSDTYTIDSTPFTPAAGEELVVLVDYYVDRVGAQQIDITPDKFGGNYYLEASTLFRDTNGVDMPAEFIIPNCKIQSNFTFTMASSGDPSAFTFTMDAFPDYTRFNPTKKVLASIQIVTEGTSDSKVVRESTYAALAGHYENSDGIIVDGNTNFTEAIANNTIVIDGVEYELTKKVDEPEETGLG